MNRIKTKLRDFKLSGIYNSLEERISYAQEKSLGYTEFLELLLTDEENNRMSNSYRKRYSQAKFPAHKTAEDFNFTFQPSINKKTINDCLTCNFIREKRNIVFVGNPGTGKTHLSIAIGINAIRKGFKVLFTSVAEMLHTLNSARADNSYYQKINSYLQVNLLVLDELGFKKLPGYSADDFFEIISTNKSFEQWPDIFTDGILASAILDRIVHYSTTIKITGPSYRSKDIKKGGN